MWHKIVGLYYNQGQGIVMQISQGIADDENGFALVIIQVHFIWHKIVNYIEGQGIEAQIIQAILF